MKTDTTYLKNCAATLTRAHGKLLDLSKDTPDYNIFRSACIKEYENILELAGNLLKKTLKEFFSTGTQVASMTYKEVFRQAVAKGIITPDICERWFNYSNIRNRTAHDYGEDFAEETLPVIADFLSDTEQLIQSIDRLND